MPTATDRSEAKGPVGLGVLGFAHAHVGMYCREWREKHGDLVTLVAGWDHDEALAFIDQHIRVPLGTCEDFMMPYAVFGLTQLSWEQGFRAAEKAKQVLEGKNPADIPITRNQMFRVWINTRLAEKIHFQPGEELMSKARIVN
jgi:hypothetical protein